MVKIVNRNKFLQLHSGTVYSKYQHMGMIEGLYQKYQSTGNDWAYQDLIGCIDATNSEHLVDVMDAAVEGKEFALDLECGERDGAYDNDAMFAIYSKSDLEKLIVRLVDIQNDYWTLEDKMKESEKK